MLKSWLQAKRSRKEYISREADVLLLLYGEAAYHVARSRQKLEPIYGEVRREIGRRQKKAGVDTATRYLGEP